MKDKGRFVDQLLDSALAHHRAAESRPGFEARLLERARAGASEQSAGGNAWKLWIAAGATVAVVMMFVAIRVANRSHSTVIETSQAAKAVPTTSGNKILAANSGATRKAGTASAAVELKQIEHRMRMSPRHVEAHHWPSQFPTPAPLTAEQKALVQYVRETPTQVLEASLFSHLSESQPTEIKPVKFSSIQIQPLTVIKPGEELQ
ncbi:MAG TPA: hypothetical protein VGW37_04590 [Terriglobia bacterium]|nr:hypothetical protein [Terriglobia bacterium]